MAKKFVVSAELKATDQASSVIGGVQSRFSKLTGFLRNNFAVGVGAGATALFGLQKALRGAVAEAESDELALRKLTASLERYGTVADATQASLVKQADALAAVTNATDDQILSVQRLLVDMGATPAQIEKATQASVDLAAALGVDLETAARQVGATLSGTAGRLAKLVPELRALDEAALKAGAGIDVLAQKFAGRAAIEADTLSGALSQLGEEIVGFGGKAVQNAGLVDLLKTAVQGLTKSVQELAAEAAKPMSLRLTETGADPVTIELAFRKEVTAALEAAAAVDKHAEVVRASNDAIAALKTGLGDTSVSYETLAAASKRAEEATARDDAARVKLTESLKASNITLRDLAAELAANEQQMRELGSVFRSTTGDTSGLDLAMSQLLAKNAALREEMAGTSESTTVLSESLNTSAESAALARSAYQALNVEIKQTGVNANATRLQLILLAQAAAEAGDIQGALAAGGRLTQGGTRIRLPGGGSRLVRPR